MSPARFRRYIASLVFAALVGCTRVAPPPLFRSASSAPFLTFLVPQGPIAATQRIHFFIIVGLVLIAVLPVLVLTPLILWRYRYHGGARYTPKWSYSAALEALMWGGPIVIVGVLAGLLVRNTQALDPYRPIATHSDPPLRVEVVGYDWKWLFIYPEFHIASIGELAFPTNRAVSFTLTSDTVMQSFFIPALGSQIYAMPGMITRLHLLANHPGSARGLNTQFNGSGFYQQKFNATAMTPDDFKAWVNHAQVAGIPLSDKAYAAIEERSTLHQTREALGVQQAENEPLLFTDVPPNLFHSVVQSFMGH